MATFTDTEIADVAEIVGLDIDFLAQHLDMHESLITEEAKTKVLSRVADWQAVDGKFTRIRPNIRNFGAEKDPGEQRGFYRDSIATLLFLRDITGTPSSQIMLSRG